MRKIFSGTLFLGIGLLAACSGTQQTAVATRVGMQAAGSASNAKAMPGYGGATRSVLTSFASLPDHGDLLAYDRTQPVKHRGAYTAYPVALSEAHALNAIGDGRELDITAPDGSQIRLKYDSHVENPDGNWSWIGHDANGGQALLTFGEQAVFGSIPQASGEPLRLTMSAGKAWMVATDGSKLAGLGAGLLGDGLDQAIPPQQMAEAVSKGTPSAMTATASANATAVAPTARVDVLLGYTTGLSKQLGSDSAAVTRLSNLVATTNLAYTNSGVSLLARLVGAVKVDYPDNTDNGDALEKLTGQKRDGTAITPDAAFTALRAARETTGADLVSLVRAFRTPENNGCGIAWLIGGGGGTFSSASAGYGYSVIGDGTDLGSDGTTTYYCRDQTLAHEMGHNMGQQHDTGNSNQAGVHPYSYGYRESAVTGFYTVMAYPLTSGNDVQTGITYFANPNVKYLGRPTGVANASDNVRSMNQTMPIVATFRATVIPADNTAPNLLGIFKQGTTATEAHSLTSASAFKTFNLHTSTGLGRSGTDSRWVFELGDYNGDGIADLWSILKVGSSGKTEVHILSGADKYKTYLLHTATILPSTGTDSSWVFKLGDYDKDGKLDLWAISKRGSSGKTEVHVLSGATKFSTYIAHVATVLAATGSNDAWKFELGDYDKDGKLDIYAIAKGYTGSGKTEMHILSGGDNFQSYITHIITPLGFLGQDNSWEMKLGDYNGDGILDLYAIAKVGSSGKTEVHVLDGVSGFQTYKLHAATALGSTGTGHTWEFLLINP